MIWIPIKGFPAYQINNLGHVRSLRSNTVLPTDSGDGANKQVALYRNGSRYHVYILNLIKENFLK